MQDVSGTPKCGHWTELDKKKKMDYKIEANVYLPIAAYLSKQKGRVKQHQPNSYKKLSSNCPFKARQQIVK